MLAATLLAAAAYWSARLAWADHLYHADTLAALRRAVALDPGNARYRAWLAELEEHDGRDPTAALEAAARLNPRDSTIWIRLGLRAETARDFPTAERDLLEAARVDRQFDPRSTLMNYSFRRGDAAPFWRWSREAFAISYGDLTPLFQLCWRMTSDPETVRAALPSRHPLLGRYLSFLLAEGRLDAAAPVARDFLAQAGAPDTGILLAWCDRLLEARRAAEAVDAWNALCARRLVPYPPLAPARGVSLTNGSFAGVPLLRGFDWRIPSNPEITVEHMDSPPGLKFSLSGKEPERCELLAQFVPLVPGRKYRLRYQLETTDIPPDSGLHWEVDVGQVPDLPSDFLFSAPSPLVRLALVYERREGTARIQGSLALRNLALGFE